MRNNQLIKTVLKHGTKGILIAVLWFGGVYAFDALNALDIMPHVEVAEVEAGGDVDVWWPTNNAVAQGVQPFKAVVKDKDVNEYDVYWSVDGGQENKMDMSSADYPHKESSVDLTNWTWRSNGPYSITFKAVDASGSTIGETTVKIKTSDADVVVKSNQESASEIKVEEQKKDQEKDRQEIKEKNTEKEVHKTEEKKTENKNKTLETWWPVNNVSISGVQPFKALVEGADVTEYDMYWSVDGGEKIKMDTSYIDAPHKESLVDVSRWIWSNSGSYKITFTATSDSKVIAEKDLTVKVPIGALSQPQAQPQAPAQKPILAPQPKPEPVVTIPLPPTPSTNSGKSSLIGSKLYVNSYSNAKRVADEIRSSRANDAYQLDKIAGQPVAQWLGGWNADISGDVKNAMNNAQAQGAAPVFVAYNIPNRDCGQYSAGGLNGAEAYRSWIQKVADAIGNGKAAVVLEPDALTLTSCLSGVQTQERFNMIKSAISILKAKQHIAVYVDAGHPGWISVDEMATRLTNAGVAGADGFSLNVSNFMATSDNISYGEQISSKIGGKHFVIDTSRNGLGANGGEWCNPSGRALGNRPTTSTGNNLVDAYLWIKAPGESDGNCNGGPSAGTWWTDYALDLARRSAF